MMTEAYHICNDSALFELTLYGTRRQGIIWSIITLPGDASSNLKRWFWDIYRNAIPMNIQWEMVIPHVYYGGMGGRYWLQCRV
jgi:hypothetical protein